MIIDANGGTLRDLLAFGALPRDLDIVVTLQAVRYPAMGQTLFGIAILVGFLIIGLELIRNPKAVPASF